MTKKVLWGLIVVLLWVMPVWAQDSDAGYQEALRRIEAARVSGATSLDLSRLGLEDIPSELGQLTQLQELQLRENSLQLLPPRSASSPTFNDWICLSTNWRACPPRSANSQTCENSISQRITSEYYQRESPSFPKLRPLTWEIMS